jgi:O-antigen/teichoic acid export membrane protein
MAVRLLQSPLSIIGDAVATASLGEIGRLIRTQPQAVRTAVRVGMRDLLRFGVVVCGLAAALGVVLVPGILGSSWKQTGVVVSLLSAGALAQFVVVPFSQVLNMTGRHAELLRWDVLRLVVLALAWSVPALTGQSLGVTVAVYSGAMVLIYWRMTILLIGRSASPASMV